MPNCAASATTKTAHFEASALGSPAASRTSAGPSACHAPVKIVASRSGGTVPRRTSGKAPITRPSATQSGTFATGRRKSIGTSASCVGSASAPPTSTWIRDAAA